VGRRSAVTLTAQAVKSCTKLGYTADAQEPGLNLQVTRGAAGYARSWLFRYTSPEKGKRREMGLGPFPAVSLARAREEAAKLRGLIRDGIDPIEWKRQEKSLARRAKSERLTFGQAAERCIATRQHEWRNAKHRAQWTATLKTYAFPTLGSLPVDVITTEHVLQVLEPIWTTKTETATRVRQRIETVLDWAKARKLLTGDNPASLKGGLGQLLPKASKIAKVVHQPALPYQQAHSFVQALRAKRGVGAKALEFLLLTGCRSGEVLGARWEEIDLERNVWIIPADRMKAGREHRVPLSSRAEAILREMLAGKQSEFVFPGPDGKRPMSNGVLLALMKGMPAYARFVPHGLRSTFRDWAAETTSYANETLELALAHTIKNRAEAAYRRGDQLEKRAGLMEQWARYLELPPKSGTVTPIGRSTRA
jgi:integrase